MADMKQIYDDLIINNLQMWLALIFEAIAHADFG